LSPLKRAHLKEAPGALQAHARLLGEFRDGRAR